jgi:enoyl-[acyl-carrier protein] reductase I
MLPELTYVETEVIPQQTTALAGKKGLVVGIANEHSIAAGCAPAFREAGAELAVTYLNEKARSYVEPLAAALGAKIMMPLDVEQDDSLNAVFERIRSDWARLDFLLHSIAYCPKADLHGRLIDSSRRGFAQAMDVSVHSFVRMARLAEPLMSHCGCLLAVSYYGAEKVVDHYRVNALSPRPLKTRAASGIDHFDELIDRARACAPEHQLVTIEDVGAVAAGLVADAARSVTGNIEFIDAGYHVMV